MPYAHAPSQSSLFAQKRKAKQSLPLLPSNTRMSEVRAGGGAEPMQHLPAVPGGGAALDDGDDLLPEAGGELLAAGAHGALLVDDVEDPHDGLAAAGARADGLRHVEGVAAARHALHAADAHDGRHRVDGDLEVDERVQRELRGVRGAWE